MALLNTNGFGHRYAEAQHFGFPLYKPRGGGATRTSIKTSMGRSSTPGLDMLAQNGTADSLPPDYGAHIAIPAGRGLGDLYFGMWLRSGDIGAGTDWPNVGIHRIGYIEVNGAKAVQVWANFSTSTRLGMPPQSIGLWDDGLQIAHTGDGLGGSGGHSGGTLLAVSAANALPAGSTAGTHLTVALERSAGSGRIQAIVDGALVLDADSIALLDVNDGPITLFQFGIRSNEWTGVWRTIGVDDFWVDDERSWGDARAITYQPVSQGFHSDGVPTGAATGWEAVAGAPPNLSTYITLDPGDKDSHVMDDAVTGDRVAVAGVTHRTVLDSDFPVGSFIRIGGTDYDLAEFDDSSVQTSRMVSVEINPDTTERFTLADLQAAEFGVEGLV